MTRTRARQFACVSALVLSVSFSMRAQQSAPSPASPPQGAPPAATPPPQGGGRGFQPQRPPRPGETAAEYYKNIKVLKDVPAEQLPVSMQFIAASLGVGCDFCHVTGPQGGFDRDDKKPKETARKMLRMVETINTQQFEGRQQVNCTTCHHGSNRPDRNTVVASEMTPGEAAAAQRASAARQDRSGRGRPGEGGPGRGAPGADGARGQQPPAVPEGARTAGVGGRDSQAEPAEPPPPAESVDDVLDKYVQALGGHDAVAQAKTRVMRGTATARDLQQAPITVQEKATGEYRIDTEGRQGTQTRAFDGKRAWMQMPNGVRDVEGVNAQQITRLADLGLPLTAKARYEHLRSARYGSIDGAPTIVLIGSPAANVTEWLHFDRTTGLLARRNIFTRTALGQLQEQVDYGDYRDVSGVKLPFQVRYATWNSVSTQRFTDVTVNAPIDDGQFARPAAPR